jgi:hypothetical protein
MRAISIAILITILASAAAAQDMPVTGSPPSAGNPPPSKSDRPLTTDGMNSVPQAPIGHRQPTLRDLPPAVQHEERPESGGRRNVDPFANVPNICNGC